MAHSVDDEVQLFGAGIRLVEAALHEEQVDVDAAARSLNPQIVLQGLHVPGEQNAAGAAFGFDGGAPFVECDHGLVAGGVVAFGKVMNLTQERLEQIDGVDTEVAERVRTLTVDGGAYSAGVGLVIGTTEVSHIEQIAAGTFCHQGKGFYHGRFKSRGMVDGNDQTLLAGTGDHEFAFRHGLCHGFFHEYVAAHIERLQGESAMRGGRREDVNGLRLC